MTRVEICARINEIGIVPCARVQVPGHALFAAETLYRSCIPILEISLTLHQAPAVIEELVKRHPDMVVGAGTVLDAEEARRAIDAGAMFITSPGYVPEVVECAEKADVTVFPGAITPSEVIAAWKAGADFVKIFPAATAGGPQYVRALKVSLTHIPLIVTGGVNQLTAFDYILAGATAIGIGSELLPALALQNKQTGRIQELARRFTKLVQEAREQLLSMQ
jgi:2-dehydro-3-deoxyphosphogluconate aldolase/(4S)-4-hydroxy-2-oxoglutarate aldolase